MDICFVSRTGVCRERAAFLIMNKLFEDIGLDADVTITCKGYSKNDPKAHFPPFQMIDAMKKYGIEFTKGTPSYLVRRDYKNYDMLICMDQYDMDQMVKMFGTDTENRLFKLLEFTGIKGDIVNPLYTLNYESTCYNIMVSCKALIREFKHMKHKIKYIRVKDRNGDI